MCFPVFHFQASEKIGYSTELGPPKREQVVKPKGVLSASVKAFLDKKEQEEKEKGNFGILHSFYVQSIYCLIMISQVNISEVILDE